MGEAEKISGDKTMTIYAGKDYQDVSRKAANIMSAQIIMKPDAVLGLSCKY